MTALLDGKCYSKEGKTLWDCSNCPCYACANNGKDCHDCKGFEFCMKYNNKVSYCPDFRMVCNAITGAGNG